MINWLSEEVGKSAAHWEKFLDRAFLCSQLYELPVYLQHLISCDEDYPCCLWSRLWRYKNLFQSCHFLGQVQKALTSISQMENCQKCDTEQFFSSNNSQEVFKINLKRSWLNRGADKAESCSCQLWESWKLKMIRLCKLGWFCYDHSIFFTF